MDFMAKQLIIKGIEPPRDPLCGYRFGCLQPDKDGRWYFPIYSNGKRVGKSYALKNHWIGPLEESQP